MNIVKFRDIILTEENAPQLSEEQRKLFNEKYKGKYTYAVDWTRVVAIEDMTPEQYVDVSKKLLDDEYGFFYTLINSVDDLKNEEGIIDDTKEYFLLSTNKHTNPDVVHTYIPGEHDLKKSLTYLDFTDIKNFDFLNDDYTPKSRFMVKKDIDNQITSKTNYRLLPYKFCDFRPTTDIVTKTITYGTVDDEYDITIKYRFNTPNIILSIVKNNASEDYIKITCYVYFKRSGNVNLSAGASITNGLSVEIANNINIQNYDEIQVKISNGNGFWDGPSFTIDFPEMPYWEIDPDRFYIQDRQYSFTPKNKEENKLDIRYNGPIVAPRPPENEEEHELDWDYYYVNRSGTSSSNKNLIYNDGQFCEYRLINGGEIYGKWYINEEKLLTNDQFDNLGNNFKLLYNSTSPRFGMYRGIQNQIYPAYLYRRDDVEPESLKDFDNIDLELLEDYIDVKQTTVSNSVTTFLESNKFSTDENITIDELKRFRTWLADVLYNLLYSSLDSITKEMLNYYRGEMNDDTIEHLSYFANDTEHDLISTTNLSSCGCQNHTQLLNNQYTISSCNPIYIYRKGVYDKMVSVFSDIDFWLKLNKEFLNEIKRYIDGIIKCNLPLYTSQFSSELHDCGCLTQNGPQEEHIQLLKDLSTCFEFLATDNYINKKNHITLTLNKWSSLLYERMRWY